MIAQGLDKEPTWFVALPTLRNDQTSSTGAGKDGYISFVYYWGETVYVAYEYSGKIYLYKSGSFTYENGTLTIEYRTSSARYQFPPGDLPWVLFYG